MIGGISTRCSPGLPARVLVPVSPCTSTCDLDIVWATANNSLRPDARSRESLGVAGSSIAAENLEDSQAPCVMVVCE